MIMKTITVAIIILMVGLVLITSCSEVQAVPQDLAKSTQKILDDVKEQDRDVFEEIQHNTEMVSKLKAEIETSDESDKQKQLNKVIKELEKITKSYEDLSSKREDIRKDLLKKITAIEKLQEDVQEETARLHDLRNTYSTTLSTFVDSDPEIVRTRKAALTQAIKYIDMQLQLWNEFYRTEQQIKNETAAVQQRIDSFLSVIESSAILFREGLNLLKLQRDINDALSLFTQDLPRMEQLSKDMEQSWSHLDTLVNTLTSMSISIGHN
jgi:DNA repair exonuclease SbcCD ATPase subunit